MAGQLRVLIVEDNRDAADSLKMLLELLGHEARVACTGPEGVAATHAYTPDVLLCDIGLPGCSGWEVVRKVHQDPTAMGVRCVAITGYATAEDRRRSAEAGFDGHLAKPLEMGELLTVLARKGHTHSAG
jgi:CheY-like chemotaxis protein